MYFISENILLTSKFKAKIGDFGLSVKVQNDPASKFERHRIAGTRMYQPEEYIKRNLLTKSVDTFSFGLVIFEMLTRERPSEKTRGLWIKGQGVEMDSECEN
jgi:serine/threonine protein kinase